MLYGSILLHIHTTVLHIHTTTHSHYSTTHSHYYTFTLQYYTFTLLHIHTTVLHIHTTTHSHYSTTHSHYYTFTHTGCFFWGLLCPGHLIGYIRCTCCRLQARCVVSSRRACGGHMVDSAPTRGSFSSQRCGHVQRHASPTGQLGVCTGLIDHTWEGVGDCPQVP